MRLILDTCVVLAAVKSRGGASNLLVNLALSGRVQIALTQPLVSEYEDVLYRPEHRVQNWTDEDLSTLIDDLLAVADLITPDFSYRPVLNDEGDEMVVEAAFNADAWIVTFNVRDFKPAARFNIRVLQPSDVLKEMYQRGLLHGEE